MIMMLLLLLRCDEHCIESHRIAVVEESIQRVHVREADRARGLTWSWILHPGNRMEHFGAFLRVFRGHALMRACYG